MSHQKLAALLQKAAHKAETSKDYPTCPGCGMVLEGWRTDDETSGTDNDDDVNIGDGAEVPTYDNRRITRLNNLARDLAAASTRTE